MDHDPDLWPYQNALRDLTALVESLPPGSPLPGERVLSERFGVARNTLRRGLMALEEQGLIVVVKGRGRFTAHRRDEAQPGQQEAPSGQ